MKKFSTFSPEKDKFLVLQKLISDGSENSCRDAFVNFCSCLAFKHNMNLEYVFTEFSIYGGKRSDLILCGTSNNIPSGIRPDLSFNEKDIVIYECKSPSSNTFNINGDYASPSKELTSAEAQLIHYYKSVTNDQNEFRKDVNAVSFKVSMGGIIIGKNLMATTDEEKKCFGAYRDRCAHFYDPLGIKIFSWEQILEDIKIFHKFD